jgi:Ca2+-binding RTX toxin-like protein
MASFSGDSGDNSILGTAGADSFDLSLGGEDSAQGGAGDDVFSMGATLDAGDRIDGGEGDESGGDAIVLAGDYSAGLVLTDATFTSIRILETLAGHHYDLTLADANIADSGEFSETQLIVEARGSTRLDDRAETAGSIFFQPHVNSCTFLGGKGDDAWSAAVAMHARDSFHGGAGFDTVLLYGSQRFTAGNLFNVEEIRAIFGADRTIRIVDANVAAGMTLRMDGSEMSGLLTFNGSAERDGRLEILGGSLGDRLTAGRGGDTISGFAGDDTLIGGAGGDQLSGGSGADQFVYRSTAESGQAADLIGDLDVADIIDLSAIDANAGKAGNQAFHLVGHFTGNGGQLVLSYKAKTDITTLAGDVNGDGKADISIHISGDHTDFTGIVL